MALVNNMAEGSHGTSKQLGSLGTDNLETKKANMTMANNMLR